MELKMTSPKFTENEYALLVEIRAECELLGSIARAYAIQAITAQPRDQWTKLADEFALRITNRPMPSDLGSPEERQFHVDISTALEQKASEFSQSLRLILAKIPASEEPNGSSQEPDLN